MGFIRNLKYACFHFIDALVSAPNQAHNLGAPLGKSLTPKGALHQAARPEYHRELDRPRPQLLKPILDDRANIQAAYAFAGKPRLRASADLPALRH
jgi:hypothetical protein